MLSHNLIFYYKRYYQLGCPYTNLYCIFPLDFSSFLVLASKYCSHLYDPGPGTTYIFQCLRPSSRTRLDLWVLDILVCWTLFIGGYFRLYLVSSGWPMLYKCLALSEEAKYKFYALVLGSRRRLKVPAAIRPWRAFLLLELLSKAI